MNNEKNKMAAGKKYVKRICTNVYFVKNSYMYVFRLKGTFYLLLRNIDFIFLILNIRGLPYVYLVLAGTKSSLFPHGLICFF